MPSMVNTHLRLNIKIYIIPGILKIHDLRLCIPISRRSTILEFKNQLLFIIRKHSRCREDRKYQSNNRKYTNPKSFIVEVF
jgi:hypothetical protein